MRVTALVVAYHGDAWLPACLESLVHASAERIHLLLVDNSGNTKLDELDLDAFHTEIVRTPYPMGFAEANNYALVHANRNEDIVLFLNQDTISTPGWIDACLASFDDERVGALSPLIRTYDFARWDPSFTACLREDGLDPKQVVDTVSTVRNAPAPALLVRTEILNRVGPFDPVFGSYYEDFDLCRRIRELGYRIVFFGSAEIAHYSGSATNNRSRELLRMRQLIRNRLLYRVRESDRSRITTLARYLLVEFPRNLARGIIGTSSSQPVPVILAAHTDLLRIADRLVSRRRDERAWRAYLDSIGWDSLPSHIQDF